MIVGSKTTPDPIFIHTSTPQKKEMDKIFLWNIKLSEQNFHWLNYPFNMTKLLSMTQHLLAEGYLQSSHTLVLYNPFQRL